MMKSQAKKLKAGDRVIWSRCVTVDRNVHGTVTAKKYNTVWIEWDDGTKQTMYAETMDCVFTQKQLDDIDEQDRVVEKVKKWNAERIKTHTIDGLPME